MPPVELRECFVARILGRAIHDLDERMDRNAGCRGYVWNATRGGFYCVDDPLKAIHVPIMSHIRLGCQPPPVWGGGYHRPMKLKPVLALNLKALMDDRKMSQMEVHRRSKIAQSSIGRILRQEVAADLDTLAAIARAFDLDPWQLLVPNIDPKNLPVMQPLSTREREMYKRLHEAVTDIAKINK